MITRYAVTREGALVPSATGEIVTFGDHQDELTRVTDEGQDALQAARAVAARALTASQQQTAAAQAELRALQASIRSLLPPERELAPEELQAIASEVVTRLSQAMQR